MAIKRPPKARSPEKLKAVQDRAKNIAKLRSQRAAREFSDPSSKLTFGQRVKGAARASLAESLGERYGMLGQYAGKKLLGEKQNPLKDQAKDLLRKEAKNKTGNLGKAADAGLRSSIFTKDLGDIKQQNQENNAILRSNSSTMKSINAKLEDIMLSQQRMEVMLNRILYSDSMKSSSAPEEPNTPDLSGQYKKDESKSDSLLSQAASAAAGVIGGAAATGAAAKAKSVVQTRWSRFLSFLERRAPKLYARVGIRLASMGAGATIPGPGWVWSAVTLLGSLALAWEVYQLWREFNNEDTEEERDSQKSLTKRGGEEDYKPGEEETYRAPPMPQAPNAPSAPGAPSGQPSAPGAPPSGVPGGAAPPGGQPTQPPSGAAPPSGEGQSAPGSVQKVVQTGPGFNVVELADGSVEKRTGSRNWRNNNPGNIEYGAFAIKNGAIGSDGRFAIFPTYEAGRKAKENLLFTASGYRGMNIAQAINRYAPPSENNTNSYIASVTSAIGVSASTLLSDLSADQRKIMLNAMEKVEGFKQGKVEKQKEATRSTQQNQEQPGASMQPGVDIMGGVTGFPAPPPPSTGTSQPSAPSGATPSPGAAPSPGAQPGATPQGGQEGISGSAPTGDIVGMGKWLQGQGIKVSEHPQFGGVQPVHRGRGHYEGRAIDVNAGAGIVEANDPVWGPKFDQIAAAARNSGYNVIWRSAGHFNHMHIESKTGGGPAVASNAMTPAGGGNQQQAQSGQENTEQVGGPEDEENLSYNLVTGNKFQNPDSMRMLKQRARGQRMGEAAREDRAGFERIQYGADGTDYGAHNKNFWYEKDIQGQKTNVPGYYNPITDKHYSPESGIRQAERNDPSRLKSKLDMWNMEPTVGSDLNQRSTDIEVRKLNSEPPPTVVSGNAMDQPRYSTPDLGGNLPVPPSVLPAGEFAEVLSQGIPGALVENPGDNSMSMHRRPPSGFAGS
jgi:hypothetical protein